MDAIQKSMNLTDTKKSLKHIAEGLNIIDVNVRGNAVHLSPVGVGVGVLNELLVAVSL